MGRVLGICISERRGTQKKEVEEAVLKENWGIEGTPMQETGIAK